MLNQGSSSIAGLVCRAACVIVITYPFSGSLLISIDVRPDGSAVRSVIRRRTCPVESHPVSRAGCGPPNRSDHASTSSEFGWMQS